MLVMFVQRSADPSADIYADAIPSWWMVYYGRSA